MKNKLGHQAPKRYRINQFNSIELRGDFAYCESHNFIYHPRIEEEKLYNAQPCYYTDLRFKDSNHNYFNNTHLHWTRFKNISLKACIRKTLKCRNIPVDTIVKFEKSWYYPKTKINNSFKFKIKKENKFDINYEINIPYFFENFTNCEFSKKLTIALRENGFLVMVEKNESFLENIMHTDTICTENSNFIDTEFGGDIAIAYGYGKKIGFSSFNNNFMRYNLGKNSILWDEYGKFNKWSQCNEISKNTSIEEIIEILKF